MHRTHRNSFFFALVLALSITLHCLERYQLLSSQQISSITGSQHLCHFTSNKESTEHQQKLLNLREINKLISWEVLSKIFQYTLVEYVSLSYRNLYWLISTWFLKVLLNENISFEHISIVFFLMERFMPHPNFLIVTTILLWTSRDSFDMKPIISPLLGYKVWLLSNPPFTVNNDLASLQYSSLYNFPIINSLAIDWVPR